MSNGFIPENIPDENAIALICAIVTDAVYRYARALIHLKDYEDSIDSRERNIYNHAYMTVNEIETFFLGDWFATIVEYLNIEITGKRLIKMIRKAPKKYCNEHGGRRRKSYGKN